MKYRDVCVHELLMDDKRWIINEDGQS